MGHYPKYIEVKGLVTPGQAEVFSKYFKDIDLLDLEEQLLEEGLGVCFDCCDAEGVGIIRYIGEMESDIGLEFFDISKEERNDISIRLQKSTGVFVDPNDITRSRYIYVG